jgi:hypothetical protein
MYPDMQGNVSFTCHGLTDAQMRLMPSLSILVEKLLQSGVDGPRLESRTDDILKMLHANAKTELAANPTIIPTPSKKAKKEDDKDKEIITYDYHGFKTSSLMGPMLVLGDEGESKQYQKLLAVQKAGEWKALLKDTTREIKKVPDWLTPYAFEAVALQHLGKTDEAIAALEFVDQHSRGNSDYDQARLLLKMLKPAE